MMNFKVKNLILVNPCDLTDETYARAMHAQSVIDQARILASFEEACSQCDYVVATSSIIHQKQKKHLRTPTPLTKFIDSVQTIDGTIGLAFGREDYGLYNEEITQCDIIVNIPTSESYLSLNLSHAVCILLYELFVAQTYTPEEQRIIGSVEKQRLYKVFSEILHIIEYPSHKQKNTEMLFQRLMGRAIPSTWEYHTLMGVFTRIQELLQDKND
jgi:TrmH family RNA methyltransferase